MRLILGLLLALPAAAHAARPFVTDDARTVDRGGYQIETFVKRQGRYGETEFGFQPAANPWGVELMLGGNWIKSGQSGDSRALIGQAKILLRTLETNGHGLALGLGFVRQTPFGAESETNPYFNGIFSKSFADDRVVLHANLGGIRDNVAKISRGTWGVGAEVLLAAPRWYGIVETYGQRGEKPTLHGGIRFWIVPNRLQLDATVGMQDAEPARRFGTMGLRILW